MRLKRMKVSGFKSFVDPTPITVPSNLVGIVGPNGCGKSNVIDAVRWVMGESSAKTLRGDQMADVIFNGSTSRKPVGKASVELTFHNDDGKVPESYANFSEIAIRRTLTRDGKSEYFINNTKARRKDIQDIFRGTGLGPRSYSIIEQGMISRIIESKPEDLRSFVEEAAGISKYKDRRRETENRIRHTRENLDRVVDIIRELDTQLRRLQRQSQAARRYKALKEEEHRVQGELLLMRRRRLSDQVQAEQRRIADMENQLQKAIAEQRHVEQEIETLRVQGAECREQFNAIQARYYDVGSRISSLEQRIEHERESRRRREQDLEKLSLSLSQIDEERDNDARALEAVRARLAELEARRDETGRELEAAAGAMRERESAFAAFQQEWDSFNTGALGPQRELEVQKSVISEQGSQVESMERRRERMDGERDDLLARLREAEPASLREEVHRHQAVVEQTAEGLKQTEVAIVDLRATLETALEEHASLSRERHSDAARLHSLREIQAAALGEDDEDFREWVRSHALEDAPQLVSTIRVAEPWQRAADAVLGPFLTAIVSPRSAASLDLSNPGATDLMLVDDAPGDPVSDNGLLARHVHSPRADITSLTGHVRVAETVEEALSQRSTLAPGQVMVTKDGTLVGPNWLRLPGAQAGKLGLLAREEEIRTLDTGIAELDERLGALGTRIETLRSDLKHQETERNTRSQALTRCNREHADLQNRLGQREAQHAQLRQRLERFDGDREELLEQIAQSRTRIEEAGRKKADAEAEVARYEAERDEWRQRRERLSAELDAARERHQRGRDARYEADTEWQIESSRQRSLEEGLRRLQTRRDEMIGQTTALSEALSGEGDPELALNAELQGLLADRERIENELNVSRQESERVDLSIRENQAKVGRIEREVEQAREQHGQLKLTGRETELRLQTVGEQIEAGKHDLDGLAAGLPEEASEADWRSRLEHIDGKINRIGPVNLVAIEEFEEQTERKTYLDAQHADLVSALETLEGVIRKIDRETRLRFKDTFDKLNEGFQSFFPQLFGGGSASLELTENDFLTAGVTVMARPPGKRNSTIHLLSGGEKALTAVSLLFSLFQLNPAPFCLLDEVDAPLDDANVERYCRTLKSLSEKTQLLVITHNKITMEAADILVGVTMSEPGVSRMVAVDVSQAVQMAAN